MDACTVWMLCTFVFGFVGGMFFEMLVSRQEQQSAAMDRFNLDKTKLYERPTFRPLRWTLCRIQIHRFSRLVSRVRSLVARRRFQGCSLSIGGCPDERMA